MAESLINLSKEVGIVLVKRSAPKIIAQCGTAVDISGSAAKAYENGVIQTILDRVYPLAYKFDDNAVLDSWAFHTRMFELEPIVESMFGNYVKKYILQALDGSLWGGTKYAPVVEGIIAHYYPATTTVEVAPAVTKQPGLIGRLFGKKEEVVTPARTTTQTVDRTDLQLKDPAYIAVFTDGENSDEAETERAFEKYKNHQVYFQFVGFKVSSTGNFSFIQRMASKYPNVGFFDAADVSKLSSMELYEELLSKKFINWYTNVKAA